MFPDTFAAVLLRTDDIPDVYVFAWDDATVAERLTAEADDEAVEAADELRLYPDEDEADSHHNDNDNFPNHSYFYSHDVPHWHLFFPDEPQHL